VPAEDHPSSKRSRAGSSTTRAGSSAARAGSSASGAQIYPTIQGDNWVYAKGELWVGTKQAAQAQGCDVSEYCWVIACLRSQQADRDLYLNFCPCQSDHGDMDSAVHKRSLAARQDVAFQAAVKSFIFAKSKDGTATSITSPRQPAGEKSGSGKGGKSNSRRSR